MKKWLLIPLVLTTAAIFIAGCSGTDVVRKYSPDSLKTILTAFPDTVTPADMESHYAVLSVDGQTSLLVSHDFGLTGNADLVMVTPVRPFLDAGLDISKLPNIYAVDGDDLTLSADLGIGTGMKDNLVDSLFSAVDSDRNLLTYHQTLDHYGIKLPQGKFEWAKDYRKNDKDIVFVIEARPMAEMGVNVQTVDGWTFKTMKDENGNDIDVLLKPYDLSK